MFIAIHNDRHNDATVHPFSKKRVAILWARSRAMEFCRHPQDYSETKLTDSMRKAGWVFDAVYSNEGDGVRVVARTLDGDAP